MANIVGGECATKPRYCDRSVTLCTRVENDVSKKFGSGPHSENDAVTLFWPKIQNGRHRVGHIFLIGNKCIVFLLTSSQRL